MNNMVKLIKKELPRLLQFQVYSKKILHLHALWLAGEEGGVRADINNIVLADGVLSHVELLLSALVRAEKGRILDARIALGRLEVNSVDAARAELADAELTLAELTHLGAVKT